MEPIVIGLCVCKPCLCCRVKLGALRSLTVLDFGNPFGLSKNQAAVGWISVCLKTYQVACRPGNE